MEKKHPEKQIKEQKERLNSYARFSGIAIQMIAIIAVGTYIGVKLDEKHPNKHNLYTLGFTLGSVIASIVYVIRRIIVVSKE
ncbi:MAG: AtpZ/AtpI family protein [Winogradskyella sp.]|uniref:AtpZ/AtpI family protein n=1 Tax=Winogradskyella sp. TaxID=1883156 RepID=UPI00185D0DA9|nr:AtpZ/AtpI family protein [Winogradskyella sp.]MBT8245488.1 AtpZ/AtpI family protein [Winogradskyella sp.]NNK22295.1 AtpZ/AtpI family protein [Winogradskyella sp.]